MDGQQAAQALAVDFPVDPHPIGVEALYRRLGWQHMDVGDHLKGWPASASATASPTGLRWLVPGKRDRRRRVSRVAVSRCL